MKPLYTVELFESQRAKQRFYWRIRHRNGNILAPSEGYARKATRTRIANALARDAGWPVVVADA